MSHDASAYRQGILGDDDEVWEDLAVLDAARERLYRRTGVYTDVGEVALLERASRYLSALPVAESGKGGRQALFRAVCAMTRGFMLHPNVADPLLQSWNRHNVPPFLASEVTRTVWRAHREEGNFSTRWQTQYPLGYLLGAERKSAGAPATRFRVKGVTGT